MPRNRPPVTAEQDEAPVPSRGRPRTINNSRVAELLAQMEKPKVEQCRLKVGQKVTIHKSEYRRLKKDHIGTIIGLTTYGMYTDVIVKMDEGKYKGQTLYLRPSNCIKVDTSKLPRWF